MPASPAKRRSKSDTEYDITIGGRYFAPAETTSGLTEKTYRVTVRMTQKLVDQGALSVWKNSLAEELMPRMYPDYQGLATHEILNTVPTTDVALTDPRLMNREALVAYIVDQELPVNPDLYGDIGAFQQAVMDCEKDETVFIEQQKLLEQRVGSSVAVKNEALALNKATIEDAKPVTRGKGKGKDSLADL